MRSFTGRQKAAETYLGSMPFPNLLSRRHPSTLIVDVGKLSRLRSSVLAIVLVPATPVITNSKLLFVVAGAGTSLKDDPTQWTGGFADAQGSDSGFPKNIVSDAGMAGRVELVALVT
jgi:hypothetical protein